VRPAGCDLSSLAALHAFTGWFGRQEQRRDVLVNNAGVMPGQRTRTVDGVELTFATHVLAPWVLIEGLATLLGNAAPSRSSTSRPAGTVGLRRRAGQAVAARARVMILRAVTATAGGRARRPCPCSAVAPGRSLSWRDRAPGPLPPAA
jgi:NAD(P)-dependent dehydrogenase (short-subunit alcohol dehydrogenase family)